MDKIILDHFKNTDKLLYLTAIKVYKRAFKRINPEKNPNNYFLRLCREIIGQQLSGIVAEVVFTRFMRLYGNKITPNEIIKTSHEKLRGVGMSNAKAKYIKNLAQTVVDGKLPFEKFYRLEDHEIKKLLTQVKGIGPWTAEMFLMFTLGRPDVFSYGDLGLGKAIKKIYGFKEGSNLRTVEKLARKWSPYKTYAALILWESLEEIE